MFLRSFVLLTCIVVPFVFAPKVFALSQEEETFLSMYFSEDELVITPTRFPKHLSQVAENMTVITAKEIEAINAHTFADVLSTVTGVGHDTLTFPGGTFLASIQGSKYEHVRFIMDGVVLNGLFDNWAFANLISVLNIEKIEIIKGPASSAWGSSLGGIIHIITKSGGGAGLGGTLTASYGEHDTGNPGAELFGTIKDLSFYVAGDSLFSDGVGPKTRLQSNNVYTKLGYKVTDRLRLSFTSLYSKSLGDDPKYFPPDIRQHFNLENLYFTVSADYSIDADTRAHISIRENWRGTFNFYRELDAWTAMGGGITHDRTYGGSARISSRQGDHSMTAGLDYDRGHLEGKAFSDPGFNRQNFTKWAVYANDTISLDRFTVTPGIRYDSFREEHLLSPSLGITYRASDRTLLRLYGAEGFNEPALGNSISTAGYTANPGIKSERIRSIQGGVETSDIRYVWIKATLFAHRIRDAFEYKDLPDGTYTYVNKAHVSRDGVEVEARTVPVHNISLSAGACLVKARDADTGEKLLGAAAATYDAGIHYDDRKSFTAVLKGRFLRWDMDRNDDSGKYSFVWDLSLRKNIHASTSGNVAIFFTARNLFNGSQYMFDLWKNPGRWVEGGITYRF